MLLIFHCTSVGIVVGLYPSLFIFLTRSNFLLVAGDVFGDGDLLTLEAAVKMAVGCVVPGLRRRRALIKKSETGWRSERKIASRARVAASEALGSGGESITCVIARGGGIEGEKEGRAGM